MGVNLEINIAGIKLANPILTASGCFGYGEEAAEFFSLDKLGGIVTKSITPLPRTGHPPPKVVETACGMLNAIGLTNVGLDKFIGDKMPFLRKCKSAVIVNIAGASVDDYVLMAERVSDQEGVDAIEVNISCPNVESGGMEFGATAEGAAKVISAVKKVSRVPVIPKLSPNVTNIIAIAKAIENAGADAVSLINTLVGTAINIETKQFKLSNRFGGLSGPAIKPVALSMVYKVASNVNIPVIGLGGILSGNDVIEFMLAGASAVQIGTACFAEPEIFLRVIDEIMEYLEYYKVSDINQIIGAAGKN
ncbi:MAG: dihydroorotate dehydrogenase [candidate division Zixibacteria bacterium]|nr:dihydroorotate dehydrogenase [candidate division Zixibacteria bacterium]